LGSGQGGTLLVTASEQLSISGRSGRSESSGPFTVVNNPSSIAANTLFGTGRAGAVTVNTPRLMMFDAALISTATNGDGPAGSLTVNAGSMNMSSGASISSSSGLNVGLGAGFEFGNGAGGTVTVNATGPVTIADQGSGLFTSTAGNGVGGNINLRGSPIQLSNGASISATSSGSGNAGSITIDAGNQLAMTNSSVTTEANQASGGAIKITTSPTGNVQLTDSAISASVLDGTGGGGSVNIDPQFVLLQNSQIMANAVFGLGGNINLTTNLLLPDSASIISASSQFGQQGTVSIQSPISPASGKIIPLSQKPLIETSLMGLRCAASAEGIYSSFTVGGRDSLPAEPGGWISTPLALLNTELVGGAVSKKDSHTSLSEPAGQMPILSLRRIAPRGFLTQSFAVDWSEACTS
jgi:large exoprotein involved in heme utilization and adhesion